MLDKIHKAAKLQSKHWLSGSKLSAFPDDYRPLDDAQGASVQALLGSCLSDTLVGWKIAATSIVGQQHINVNGPMAGRLFASRVLAMARRYLGQETA